MPTLDSLHQEIQKIKSRNQKVELDKAWEVSFTRKLLIALLTYFVITTFFIAAQLPSPWINSLIPAIAFLISTQSLPFLKKIWIKHSQKKKYATMTDDHQNQQS